MVPNFKLDHIHDYSELIKTDKIQAILNNMPKGLTKIEKAYYVYIELGKIISKDPNWFLASTKDALKHYDDNIDDNYFGICKSISELYSNILKDERIGIETDLIKKYPDEEKGSHIDTILKIDGKFYLANLIADLINIKTNMRVKNFARNVNKICRPNMVNNVYTNMIEEYKSMSYLSTADLEKMDMKLGYSYGRISSENGDNERGIYTNDVYNRLEEELKDTDKVNEYIFRNKKIPQDEILDYKIRYLCKNMDKFIDINGTLSELELVSSFIKLVDIFTSEEESKRIKQFAIKVGQTNRNFISVLKVNPLTDEGNNTYYIYKKGEKTYKPISLSDLKEYLGKFNPNDIRI